MIHALSYIGKRSGVFGEIVSILCAFRWWFRPGACVAFEKFKVSFQQNDVELALPTAMLHCVKRLGLQIEVGCFENSHFSF